MGSTTVHHIDHVGAGLTPAAPIGAVYDELPISTKPATVFSAKRDAHHAARATTAKMALPAATGRRAPAIEPARAPP